MKKLINLPKPKKNFLFGFTTLELVVVIGIIAILAAILFVILSPQKILSKARDGKRISDLSNYEANIKLALLDPYLPDDILGESNIIYLSLKDSSEDCDSHLLTLPSLPAGWSYKCSNSPQNSDGTGWIPINFASSSILNINQLNLDPKNEELFYYSYVVSESNNFELTAYLEYEGNIATTSSPSADDEGTTLELYEAGDDKTITPIEFEEGRVEEKINLSDKIIIANPDDISKTYPIDGNITTYFSGVTGPNYWVIDLGSIQTTFVKLWKYSPREFIRYSQNGTDWTFIESIESGGSSSVCGDTNAWYKYPVVNARYYRYDGQPNAPQIPFQLCEFEVYAP